MIKHFELPHNLNLKQAGDMFELTGKIVTHSVNCADDAVITEIRKIAEEAGATDVYILDKQQITKMFVEYERYRQIGTPEEFRDAMETLKRLEKWMDDMK
jgi:hypothetical protein